MKTKTKTKSFPSSVKTMKETIEALVALSCQCKKNKFALVALMKVAILGQLLSTLNESGIEVESTVVYFRPL
jgi:hypothetical protein